MTEPNDPVDADAALEETTLEGAELERALEAMLIMADAPVPTAELATGCGTPVPAVDEALGRLTDFYRTTGRGFELRRVAGGWRYYTAADQAAFLGRWVLQGRAGRLSRAAVETLAVIAYLQPVPRSRVSAVRGVSVDAVVRTLLARDLVSEVDRDERTGAVLLGTTDRFLELLGLGSLDELPPIAPLLPDASLLEQELAGLAMPGESEADE